MINTLSKKKAKKLAMISENASTNWDEYEQLEPKPTFLKDQKKNK